MKTKLFSVTLTHLPLQGHITLLSLPPPLASSHTAWLSVPTSGPCHSCFLHLQLFLPPSSMSQLKCHSLREAWLPTPLPTTASTSVLWHVSQSIISCELMCCLLSVAPCCPDCSVGAGTPMRLHCLGQDWCMRSICTSRCSINHC